MCKTYFGFFLDFFPAKYMKYNNCTPQNRKPQTSSSVERLGEAGLHHLVCYLELRHYGDGHNAPRVLGRLREVLVKVGVEPVQLHLGGKGELVDGVLGPRLTFRTPMEVHLLGRQFQFQFFISIHTEQYNFCCFSNYLCH